MTNETEFVQVSKRLWDALKLWVDSDVWDENAYTSRHPSKILFAAYQEAKALPPRPVTPMTDRVWEAAKEWYHLRNTFGEFFEWQTVCGKLETAVRDALNATQPTVTDTPATNPYDTLLTALSPTRCEVIAYHHDTHSVAYRFGVPAAFAAAVLADMGYAEKPNPGEYDITPRGWIVAREKLRSVEPEHPFLQISAERERFYYMLEF